MRTRTKIWLIIATSLVLIGCIIFSGVMTMLKWDFTKLSTSKYDTNNYEITENFNNISIITSTADILFLPSKIGYSTAGAIKSTSSGILETALTALTIVLDTGER